MAEEGRKEGDISDSKNVFIAFFKTRYISQIRKRYTLSEKISLNFI